MTIAERLVAARGSVPQEAVAASIGISRSAMTMYETGKRIPRDEIKVRLADFYGKTVQELFFNRDEEGGHEH